MFPRPPDLPLPKGTSACRFRNRSPRPKPIVPWLTIRQNPAGDPFPGGNPTRLPRSAKSTRDGFPLPRTLGPCDKTHGRLTASPTEADLLILYGGPRPPDAQEEARLKEIGKVDLDPDGLGWLFGGLPPSPAAEDVGGTQREAIASVARSRVAKLTLGQKCKFGLLWARPNWFSILIFVMQSPTKSGLLNPDKPPPPGQDRAVHSLSLGYPWKVVSASAPIGA